MDPKIKEALGHFLSKEPVKGFETLKSVMEGRALTALQDRMAQVGQNLFKESK